MAPANMWPIASSRISLGRISNRSRAARIAGSLESTQAESALEESAIEVDELELQRLLLQLGQARKHRNNFRSAI